MAGLNITQTVNEKFRFRRKCDENSFVRLLAQVVTTNGVTRTMEITGKIQVIIRTR